MKKIAVESVIITAVAQPVAPRPDRTRAVARGVSRLMRAGGFAVVQEMTFASGRRADVVALGPDSEIVVIEVKSSLEDFRTDRKWPDYRDYCDRLFFAVDADFPVDVLDPEVGLIVADAYGGAIIREAPVHKLVPARRRALTIAFAHLAAQRLALIADPESGIPR
ncbi:MAG: MmcB family DNA repair protein [Beijerinckiaceae bacterium]